MGNKLNSKYFKYVNNRPEGVAWTSGDCSTRCISYCLGKSYEEILKIQENLAKCTGWKHNSENIWDQPLLERGWIRIYLEKPMRRYMVAKLTECLKFPFATYSSGHVCPIHNGKVIDISQTQNGIVDYVVVRKRYVQKIRKLLDL